jgi:photosystem II stability/assembly factor-like uncharacterized protein
MSMLATQYISVKHRISLVFTLLLQLLLGVSVNPSVSAHEPHDVVGSIAISPNFSADQTVFALVRSNVLRSSDGGLSWKRLVHGLDNISHINNLFLDADWPRALYLTTDADGIYRSTNSGSSWSKFSQGLGAGVTRHVYISPHDANGAIFASAGESSQDLYRTTNQTDAWVRVYQGQAPITAISGLGWSNASGQNVLLGDANGYLRLSKDAGIAWTVLHRFDVCGAITTISTLKSQPSDLILIGTSQCGLFKSRDGGQTFVPSNFGMADLNVRGVAISPDFSQDSTVYVVTGMHAVYVSSDAGVSWHLYDDGIVIDPQGKTVNFNGVQVSPNYNQDRTLFVEGFAGLFKSCNRGGRWIQMNTMPITLMQSVAVSPDYATDGTAVLATYRAGIYKSRNPGKLWEEMAIEYSARNSDITYSPGYFFDQTLFASIGGPTRIAKSTDGGTVWKIQKKFPVASPPTILALSPEFDKDKTLFVATRSAHVLRSVDGGQTFVSVYDEGDLSCAYCSSGLAVSPNFGQDRLVLFASETANTGIQVSHDGGVTWQNKGSKLDFGQHIKLAFSPNYAVDHTLFIGGAKGLFRSNDELASWVKVSAESRGVDGFIEELAVSPDFKHDQSLLISVRGKGLFKSQDRGWNFRPVGLSLIADNHIFGLWYDFPVATSSLIQFSPYYAIDRTIYGSSSDWLFRSTDAGETWQALLHNTALGQVAPFQECPTEPLPEIPVMFPQGQDSGLIPVSSTPVYPGPHAKLAIKQRGRGRGIVTSTPEGIVCGEICDYQFTKKTKVKLRVTPIAGFKFLGWGGACNGRKSVCTINMKRNRKVKVRFR